MVHGFNRRRNRRNILYVALLVTAYEFAVGSVGNLWLGWEVWDYSALPGNVLGQICPQFTCYWFMICLAFFSLIKYNKDMFF